MFEALKFVQGAVSEKDLVPVLTHFHIKDGEVQGSNGRLTISAPVEAVGDVIVPAALMIKALDACKAPEVKITEKSVMVKDGKFSARLPKSNDVFPVATKPVGETLPVSGLVETLRKLRPFVGDDATRLWACGVLFRGGYAYATNNVTIAEANAPAFEREMVLPTPVIDELLRIKVEPDHMVMDETTIGFYWGDRWLKAKVLTGEWPPVQDMINRDDLPEIPKGLADAVSRIAPFCDDKKFPVIEMTETGIRTQDGLMQAEVGGYEFAEVKYHAEALALILKTAKLADFSQSPAPWSGNNLRGLISQVIG